MEACLLRVRHFCRSSHHNWRCYFWGGLDLVLLDLAEQLFNRLLGTLSVAQNSWVLNQAPSEVEESTLLLLQKACNVALHYGRH